MNITSISMVQALSIAGSTFAIGITLGWILALLNLGGSSDGSKPRDRDD